MMQAPRRTFDASYYERFYHDPHTRAVTVQGARRQARFVAGLLRFLGLPVRRVLDLGCGPGWLLNALGREFPRASCTGVEWSEYLCERYGWEPGSVVDWHARTPFDLVVCYDVLQYLPDREAATALDNLRRLTRGALYLGVLTAEDWSRHCDRSRSDGDAFLRCAAWYRRRLARRFVHVGAGVHLVRPEPVPVWTLEQAG